MLSGTATGIATRSMMAKCVLEFCLRNQLRGVGQLSRGVIPSAEETSAAEKFFDYRLPTLAQSIGISVIRHEPTPEPVADNVSDLQPVDSGQF